MTPTTTAAGGGLIDRVIRAARLDSTVYEEVEHDTTATTQAATVVVAGALASAFAAAFGPSQGGVSALVIGVVFALLGWLAYAGVAFLVGTKLLAGPQTKATFIEVARTLGFASAPQILLVAGIVPILGGLLQLAVAIWGIATTIVAARAVFDVETGRAVGIAVVSWIALFFVSVMLASILVVGTVVPQV